MRQPLSSMPLAVDAGSVGCEVCRATRLTREGRLAGSMPARASSAVARAGLVLIELLEVHVLVFHA